MTQALQLQSTAIDVAELKKLFGPPSILSTEGVEIYDAMMNRFVECIHPEDFIVLMLVKDLTVWEWEVLRLTRHKTWAIDRKFRQRLERQVHREAIDEQRRKAMVQRDEGIGKSTAELDRLYKLEDVVQTSIEDIDRILNTNAEDRDYAQGLEDAIDYYERLDRNLNVAIARRNDCLEQIWRYRTDLSQQLRKECVIIEGEFKSVEEKTESTNAPLVPSQSEA